MTDTAAVARRFLETLQGRDWDAWTALMRADVVYEMPQTRERCLGRDNYLEFNRTYPGEWELIPHLVIGAEDAAVVWFRWRLDGSETGDAQVFLAFDDAGLISRVTDFWPEPYDPPARPDGLVERG